MVNNEQLSTIAQQACVHCASNTYQCAKRYQQTRKGSTVRRVISASVRSAFNNRTKGLVRDC